jgi:hypothetical protein
MAFFGGRPSRLRVEQEDSAPAERASLNVSFRGLRDSASIPFLSYPPDSHLHWGRAVMGRTIPSWRIIVEQEITTMSRFKQFLGPEDRAVFDDLLSQCKLYAAEAGVLASPVKEVPLLLSMIFAQHKKLIELEKRINETPN